MFDIAHEPSKEQLEANFHHVCQAIEAAGKGRKVQLVAVSKTKSPGCLQTLYHIGQRVFGENYVQELVCKAPQLPNDIQWHFIGHLQSNKVKELLEGVPGLSVVETVDSEKLANKLQHGCANYRGGATLDIYIQVNTSGEESKSGTSPGQETVELARAIQLSCPLLRIKGLMTIGMADYTSRPENFATLVQCRKEVAEVLSVDPEALELSMGMSGDYLNAIEMGSTVVRVGTSLFGKRVTATKKNI